MGIVLTACRGGTDVMVRVIHLVRSMDLLVAQSKLPDELAADGPRFAGLRDGMLAIHLHYDTFLTTVKKNRDKNPQRVVEAGAALAAAIIKAMSDHAVEADHVKPVYVQEDAPDGAQGAEDD